ncbi:MAG: CPBP family intramembrane metalloprotease [Saprospiraceae bacterium]|nr:CPBP family intramembrane metalloprotease [Saprospiraceae bacterium]
MKRLVIYFALAYGITWLIWLPLILGEYGFEDLPVLPKYHHYLGSMGPAIAALIMAYQWKGLSGVKSLIGRIFLWRVHWKWYVIVLIVPLMLVVGAGYLDQMLNDQPFSMTGFSTNDEFPQFGPLAFLLFNFVTFGVGEETGWRGFALPVLQNKFNALIATLILAVGWACWHIPAFLYRPLYSQMDVAGIIGFFMSMVMGAVVLTWLYNGTRGSLWIVAWFHAMIELMFMSDNVTVQMSTYEGAAIMIGAILIILLAGPKNLSGRERQRDIELVETERQAAASSAAVP